MTITIEECDQLLPQTQCRECGYNGCRPYAEALVSGQEQQINRCRPGGQGVVDLLAALFQRPSVPPQQEALFATAKVRVDQCIGCTLCIQACPVDALVGAAGYQHQVIEQDCTGCQLCVPVCPTACIDIVERDSTLPSPDTNRMNMGKKQARLERAKKAKMEQHRSSIARLGDRARFQDKYGSTSS